MFQVTCDLEEGQSYKAGKEAGTEWGKDQMGRGRSGQFALRRVAIWKDHADKNNAWERQREESILTMADCLHFAIAKEFRAGVAFSRDECQEFWGALAVSEEKQQDEFFIKGFADGAVSVWNAVKDKVQA